MILALVIPEPELMAQAFLIGLTVGIGIGMVWMATPPRRRARR